ncbi:B3 DNA-binding domain protein, partial [Trifolium pratense]
MSFTKRPEFRKIVQDQKTNGIPKHYGEKYWKGTPNPIILRLPNDFEQEISWVESNGGSHFKVKIFGPNGLEINYADIKSVNEEVVEVTEKVTEIIEVRDDESGDEIEILKQAQRTRNGKRKFQ